MSGQHIETSLQACIDSSFRARPFRTGRTIAASAAAVNRKQLMDSGVPWLATSTDPDTSLTVVSTSCQFLRSTCISANAAVSASRSCVCDAPHRCMAPRRICSESSQRSYTATPICYYIK